MKLNFQAQGGKQLTFNVRKNAVIQVNNKKTDLSDIPTGKQAQITYITKNNVNRAKAVEVVGDGG
jgi:hypothetical protein